MFSFNFEKTTLFFVAVDFLWQSIFCGSNPSKNIYLQKKIGRQKNRRFYWSEMFEKSTDFLIQFQFRKKDTFFCCSRFFVAVDFLWQGSDQKQKKSRNHFSTAKKNRRFHSSWIFKKSTDFSAVEFEFSFNFKKRPIFLWQSIFCCSRFFVVEI